MNGQSYNDDSVKFNWNVFPLTRLENSKLVTPLACLYDAFDEESTLPQVQLPPISCQKCDTYINPYIKFSRQNQIWWCPFCESTNKLPSDLHIPEKPQLVSDWPIQLQESSTSVEYKLPKDINQVNDYQINHIFVVDLYQHKGISDFNNLQKCLLAAIEKIPNGHFISLITYDDTVTLHGVGDHSVSLSLKDLPQDNASLFQQTTIDKITSVLKLSLLCQLNHQTKNEISSLINSWNPNTIETSRIPRCTGFALYLSILLANNSAHSFNSIKLFTSGPSTVFPGNIVELGDSIRSYNDLVDSKSNLFSICRQFYDTLAYIACGLDVKQSWEIAKSNSKRTTEFNIVGDVTSCTIDVFVGSVEQVGLKEMESLLYSTMGNIFMFENWNLYTFKSSLLESVKINSFNHTLSINTSDHLKVSHLIGGGYALPSTFALTENRYHFHHDKISDHLTEYNSSATKKLFTNRWRFPLIRNKNTLGVYFGVNTLKSSIDVSAKSTKEAYVQLQLKFFDLVENCWKLRVTTTKRPTTHSFSFPKGKVGDSLRDNELLKGFDQKCWVVLLSRLLVNKLSTDFEDPIRIIELIDKSLIKLLYHFGNVSFKINNIAEYSSNPYSKLNQIYKINESFHLLPSLVYNFRKNSHLIKMFNSSPDESMFYYNWYVRADLKSSITMIQPNLYKFNDTEAIILSLDSNCLTETGGYWLILDSVFRIVLFYLVGKDHSKKLPLHPSNNDHLLNDPALKDSIEFANQLKLGRQPESKFIITQTHHSQSRYLTSWLNPVENDLIDEFSSISLNEKTGFMGMFKKASPSLDTKLMTEDISLKVYYKEILRKVKKYDP